MIISLNDGWKMIDGEDEYVTDLPADNFTVLLKAGVIPHPFYGTNEKCVQTVARRDFTFEKVFDIDVLPQGQRFVLRIDGLDTLATITLNGKRIADTANAHIDYSFDVSDTLTVGENKLSILLRSPVKYVEQKQKEDKFPPNFNGMDGVNHLRKPSCQFGWDWGPSLPYSGIGGARLTSHQKGRIVNFRVNQTHQNGQVRLDFETETESFDGKDLLVQFTVTSPDGKNVALPVGQTSTVICNPRLWWANGMTASKTQPLYTVVARLFDGDELLEETSARIGLRTIALNRNKDEYGENFCFELNGKRIFCKGASVIPIDCFPLARKENDVDFYVQTTRDSNMNMLRVWGGGRYGSDRFYDLCDEYGILVWQDFCFACMPYPFYDDEFRVSVCDEARYNVRRLRNHPSLALWCGNNEVEAMSASWILKPTIGKSQKTFFYQALADLVEQEDGSTPYVAGSPIGSAFNKKVQSVNVGDTHLWAVWHGLRSLSFYRKKPTRFCSEFGLESLPCESTIRRFAPEKEITLRSPSLKAHQKCSGGNDKMLYYLATKYNVPKSFWDLIYLTQLVQKECVVDATEFWHRNSGRCNGALFWQFNDCWPTASWSGIDYFGNYKAVLYALKRVNAPVTVSIENNSTTIDVYALNDTLSVKNITIKCRIVSFTGETLFCQETPLTLDGGCKKVLHFDCKKLVGKKVKQSVFVAETYVNGACISQKTTLFDKEKRLPLPRADVRFSVEEKDDVFAITLRSNVFARDVMLSLDNGDNFDDNFFDLLPCESKTVTIAKSMNLERLERELRIVSVGDVLSDKSKLRNLALRVRVALKPSNVLNFFAYLLQ